MAMEVGGAKGRMIAYKQAGTISNLQFVRMRVKQDIQKEIGEMLMENNLQG